MIKNVGRNKQYIDVHPGRNAGRVRKIIHGSRETAQRIVNALNEKHYAGLFGWPTESKTTVSTLIDLVVQHHTLNACATMDRTESYAELWKELIGNKLAKNVTNQFLKDLAQEWRTVPQIIGNHRVPIVLEAGTINQRIKFLLKGFKLGLEQDPPLVTKLPIWHNLKENAPRSGFVTWPDFQRLRDLQPEWAQIPSTIGHWCGMRVEEILGLDRSQVRFDHKAKDVTIDLRPGETKNGEPRFIVLSGDPYERMAKWEAKTAEQYPTCLHFCHKNGQRIYSIRYAWEKSSVETGLAHWRDPKAKTQSLKGYEGLLFHDLRRTGVRHLKLAGVDDKTVMLIIGHKTDSMLRRYFIQDDEVLRQASQKLNGYIKSRYNSTNTGGQSVDGALP